MNFFDRQDRARRATRWLVVVYLLATALIVVGVTLVAAAAFYTTSSTASPPTPETLIGIALAVAAVIVGATLYKTARLSSGGGRVAQDMGGTLVAPGVTDPLRQRLRNVVEEMAIASGVPVPEIYVLEEEHGINAFAAGFSSGDAAVAVTRGCLELLDRDELQGVIAHEFSHILNGDMRLNIRMMGVLFGIMVISLIGRMILRGTRHRGYSSNRNNGVAVVFIIGIGLTILGWIGLFFAKLIKAAVSRQREYLADASAVQFTRSTTGIANALKKIGGYGGRSYIHDADPEEVSHMLFASGVKRFANMFATHPPLTRRIQALDPSFSETDYPTVDPRERRRPSDVSEQASGFAAAAGSPRAAHDLGTTIVDAVGHPDAEHVDYARGLRASIPVALYDAAHAPDEAMLLTIALAMSDADDVIVRQLSVIQEQLGADRATAVQTLKRQVDHAGVAYRLPLLEIAFPMLRIRPRPQIDFLLDLIEKLIQIDAKVTVREYCFFRMLKGLLDQAAAPARAERRNRVNKSAAQQAAVDLIRVVADAGNDKADARQHAFRAGILAFGAWAERITPAGPNERRAAILERSLDTLSQLNSAGRQSLLKGVSETISHDGRLTLPEAELLRAICAALACPLPPILSPRADNS